ncbi:hypothetical protein ACOSQ2_008872 [Xanthoceras sorbifolium]
MGIEISALALGNKFRLVWACIDLQIQSSKKKIERFHNEEGKETEQRFSFYFTKNLAFKKKQLFDTNI